MPVRSDGKDRPCYAVLPTQPILATPHAALGVESPMAWLPRKTPKGGTGAGGASAGGARRALLEPRAGRPELVGVEPCAPSGCTTECLSGSWLGASEASENTDPKGRRGALPSVRMCEADPPRATSQVPKRSDLQAHDRSAPVPTARAPPQVSFSGGEHL